MHHDTPNPNSAAAVNIVLITAPDCHFCAEGIAVLARLAAHHPLTVREIAWSSADGQALVARHGILFPPGLLVDDAFVGFGRVSERKLRRILERRSTAIAVQGG
jgi:hypothetical protein